MHTHIFVIILSTLCFSFQTTARPMPEEKVITTSERPWVTEAEFAHDATLHATGLQTIVLDLESRIRGKSRMRKNSLRFLVDSERNFSFCIPADEPHIVSLKLQRAHGRTVLKSRRGKACKPVTLQPGSYKLDIFHDSHRIKGSSKKAFLHLPGRPRTFGETTIDDTPVTFGRPDFIAFRGPNMAIVTDDGTSEAPIPLMSTKSVVGPTEVFRLSWSQSNRGKWRFGMHDGNGLPVLYLSAPDECAPDKRIYVGPDHGGLYCEDSGVSMIPNDHGGGAFDLFMRGGGPIAVNDLTELYNLAASKEFPGDTMQLLYKGFNSEDFTLQKGEVAFYAQCDYGSPAIVFSADTPSLAIFEQAATAGLGVSPTTALALRVGPDTLVSIYAEGNYQGEAVNVGADTPCLSEVQVTAVQSIRILDRDDYIVSSQGCVRCVLNGIDFDGEDLSGYDFTDTLFNAASLRSVRFHSTDLQGSSLHQIQVDSMTDFTGAILKCSSFVAADLTQAIFGNNIYQTDSSCLTSFERATIDYSQFETSLWRNFDLTASNVTNVPDTLSTMSSPLDLSGTNLSNVVWLAGKNLDSANLGCYANDNDPTTVCPVPNGTRICTTLQGTALNLTSLKKTCLSEASMEGVFLSFANLDLADMSNALLQAKQGGKAATLQGAFMRGVNLTGANLTGVNASNVNFYSVSGHTANATAVTAPGANFSGAYLAGADFSGSTSILQSTIWSGAMLLGANFSQADLSVNTSGGVNSGTNTTFNGAYLQGALFASAYLDAVDFTNTYWDVLGAGGNLTFLIPEQSLEFAGYWKDISLPECPPALSYDSGNPPPMNVTNAKNTCPNGGPGPCDAVWGQPVQPIADSVPFKSAVSPDFPQDPSASTEHQCSNDLNDPNPKDYCWTITTSPTLCSEN